MRFRFSKGNKYSIFSNKQIMLIMFFAFMLFIIGNLMPKVGLDIYLIVRWLLLLGVPIALICEFFMVKKQSK